MERRLLGDKIRFYRKKNMLTQEQLAQLVGIKESTTISKIEKGLFYPNLHNIFLMANALNVNVDDLASGHLKKSNFEFPHKDDALYGLLEDISSSDDETLKIFMKLINDYKNLKLIQGVN